MENVRQQRIETNWNSTNPNGHGGGGEDEASGLDKGYKKQKQGGERRDQLM